MGNFARICGGLGGLLLLSSPFTLLISSENKLGVGIKAGLGLLLLSVFLAAQWKKWSADAKSEKAAGMGGRGRAGFFYASTVIYGVVALALAIGVNFIAAKRGKSYDLTNKKVNSLSSQTTQVLSTLHAPVKAIGFFSKQAADVAAREAYEQLFKRYAAESSQFSYEFRDPAREPTLTQRYEIKEGQSLAVVVRGSGAQESHAALAYPAEQELTNALNKLTLSNTQKVYVLVGHGEHTVDSSGSDTGLGREESSAMSELKASLTQEGYAVESLNLLQAKDIPSDASVLVVAAPQMAMNAAEISAIDAYLEQGGRMMYFTDLDTDDSSLQTVLLKYGIRIEPGTIIENLRGQLLLDTFTIASNDPPHPIMKDLKKANLAAVFSGARGLAPMKDPGNPGLKTEVVATTTPSAWIETSPLTEDADPKPDNGEKSGALPIVLASTWNTEGAANKRNAEAKLLVFGDASQLTNKSWGSEPNRNLILNAFAWASNQVERISIRPPDRDISTIDLDDAMLAKIRLLSMDLLPLLLLGTGLTIWLNRRNK